MTNPELRSPALKQLRWATATAAFQIEGSRTADGRGRSIWDDVVETPGAIKDATTADPAADSYRRADDDVALLQGLDVDSYRFGISWVRVQPDGTGPANRAGLDYYDRLVDALLAAGVRPFPTLYHWDLPVALEERGGWLDRDTATRFADYAGLVGDRLGDRVTDWYTINEPAMTTLQGYGIGTLAPLKQLLFGALPTVHHQLLAHALAARALRARGAQGVGIVNNHTQVRPLRDAAEDHQAAAVYDLLHNRIFADPLLGDGYPDLEALGLPPMPVRDGDLELIGSPQDFYGVNFYNPTTVTAAPDGSPLPFDIVPTPGAPTTGFGPDWPIVPEALTGLLVDLKRRYAERMPPVHITENGASFPEPDAADRVQDDERISYLAGHIGAVAAAIEGGVDVREYTVWSLMDNFEWLEGYTQRFGLVHVDFATGERTPKASYDWYRDLIAASRA
ncbi:beta-glucosidase [Microbacterium mangrovi]|uniref:Beta-glucosidase n=1 Tax=Microbacterium mangrovi TaxID=1348253 RepID=A0A0B2A5B4_9MICO|nr:GH1 family beta-glucosidase [Microbacterium mangrovi]KHK98250.1 beta-glucosidase [Microbacterium mangrovi]